MKSSASNFPRQLRVIGGNYAIINKTCRNILSSPILPPI